jgi:hypothetical protein
MHTIAGRNAAELEEFRERWGWQNATTNWKKAIRDPEMRQLLAEFRRQALHAGTLGFVHPTRGEYLEFQTQLPGDMEVLLSALRGENRRAGESP